jgi:hypothetical protein
MHRRQSLHFVATAPDRLESFGWRWLRQTALMHPQRSPSSSAFRHSDQSLRSCQRHITTFGLPAGWRWSVRTARLRYAQAPRVTSPVLRRCQSERCAQMDITTLRRSSGSASLQQRSRVRHPAHRKAPGADGREPNTTASGCAIVCCISQLARRVRHAKPPRIGSLAHRAGQLLAAVVALARYGHPLRFYIRPHCPQCPAVTALKLRLVPVTAARPVGEGNGPYAKWPLLGVVVVVALWHGQLLGKFSSRCLRPVITS